MNYNDKNLKSRARSKFINLLSRYSIIMVAIISIVTGMFFGYKNHKCGSDIVLSEKFTEDNVYSLIIQLNIEHPDIVMAQCILESGSFSSEICKEANNIVGMKVPKYRPTVCLGVHKGHAVYVSWRECLIDYALWQSAYCKGLTREEYFKYLDKVYSQVDDYSERIKRVIKSRNL